MARKTVLVCDNCGVEVVEGKGALMRANPDDRRRPSKQADVCSDCFDKLPGTAVARRGRKPQEAL